MDHAAPLLPVELPQPSPAVYHPWRDSLGYPPAVDLLALGQRLRALRTEAGLTQQAVADRAGVTDGWISRIERGDGGALTLRTLERVVEAVGARLDLRTPTPDEEDPAAREVATLYSQVDEETRQAIRSLLRVAASAGPPQRRQVRRAG